MKPKDIFINPKYRNVICPWQSARDIKTQQKTLDRMLDNLNLTPEAESKLLLLDKPDWKWK